MKKPVLFGILFVVLVLGVIIYSSMNLATHRVEVCVEFNGRTNCKTAAGATVEFAEHTAVDNASRRDRFGGYRQHELHAIPTGQDDRAQIDLNESWVDVLHHRRHFADFGLPDHDLSAPRDVPSRPGTASRDRESDAPALAGCLTGIVPRDGGWQCIGGIITFSDREGDPHSPYLLGLWNVLFGNYFIYRKEIRNGATIRKYTPDHQPDLIDRIPGAMRLVPLVGSGHFRVDVRMGLGTGCVGIPRGSHTSC